jgi:protein-S-isoprenylcysteine O-methyltransferase Ste14
LKWLLAVGSTHPTSSAKTAVQCECMKAKQIIGVLIMLSGVVCFWFESADRSQADWKIDALGIILVLFGLWVGKFNFKTNKDDGAM